MTSTLCRTLHFAAASGRNDVAHVLIKSGASLDAINIVDVFIIKHIVIIIHDECNVVINSCNYVVIVVLSPHITLYIYICIYIYIYIYIYI